MYKSLSVLLISSVVLAGCGQSRLNPLNWFGSATTVEAPDPARPEVNPLIPERSRITARDTTYKGLLVADIKSMKVERIPGGAVVRVTGVAAAQGSHDVRLEALNDGAPIDGVLVYELRAVTEEQRTRTPGKVGNERTRLITAASFVSDQALARVRSIEVRGQNNALASRR
ncbi:hypothetical protein [Thalassovita mediterranea]|jgi:hypothetical protein|uniref:Lipoprotein n=1 Tax=Thalassovita mediterranea TaxID=340021 RepID=A0A0P1GMF7_9RHOB|nr:hypothetical protein [Thalassovita mediterranea]MCG7572111.1 hypothetical protein [Phaeobacter sp. CNT1-3]CUH83367.1 hypothetical protein TM5383_00554 [Thalassovita mediterranea]SIS34072.1 hypothetical protein SAMN05421685_109106 [Thalassovita mediterranea]